MRGLGKTFKCSQIISLVPAKRVAFLSIVLPLAAKQCGQNSGAITERKSSIPDYSSCASQPISPTKRPANNRKGEVTMAGGRGVSR